VDIRGKSEDVSVSENFGIERRSGAWRILCIIARIRLQNIPRSSWQSSGLCL